MIIIFQAIIILILYLQFCCIEIYGDIFNLNPAQYIVKASFGGTSSEALKELNYNFNPQPVVLLEDTANSEAADCDQYANENYGWYRHDLFHYRYEGREVLPQIISDNDMEVTGKDTDEYPNVTITQAGLHIDVSDASFMKNRKP